MSSESEGRCDSCYRCNMECGHHTSALATERKARSEAEARALVTENRINAALMMSQSREENAVERAAKADAERDALRADLKRKEEAIREARDLAIKEPRKNPTARLEAVAAILSAALSPSPEGRSEERRHRFEARDDSSADNCAACGEEWAATVHSPIQNEDVQHLRNPDGSCVVSLGGQGHMPCGVHSPAKAESPARCAKCGGPVKLHEVPALRRWVHANRPDGRDHDAVYAPTTPEPQEGK